MRRQLLMGLVLGAILGIAGWNLIPSLGGVNPTTAHQSIIDNFAVEDIDYDSVLYAECVEAVKSPQLSIQTPGEEYDHSVWIWYTSESQGYSGKDANLAMEMWGPFDDGTFWIGASKLAGNTLRVWYSGDFIIDMEEYHWSGRVSEDLQTLTL